MPELLESPLIDELISHVIGPDSADQVIARLGDLEAHTAGIVHVQVFGDGRVANAPNQLAITSAGAPSSAGRFTLKAPAGWQWFIAIGGGVSLSAVRIVNCWANNAGDLEVFVMNSAGAGQSVDHYVMGRLVPA